MPIGTELPSDLLKRLLRGIEEIFGYPCRMADEILRIPSDAFDPNRRQYLSTAFLEALRERCFSAKYASILGVTEVDLFVPGLNFVFGEADCLARVAIISLCRLKQEFYGLRPNLALLEERALKEAVHELGHTFGLVHCPNSRCVMHFSNSILDTDFKSAEFCSRCSSKFKRVLRRRRG